MRIHLLCRAGLVLAACAGPADETAGAGAADRPQAQAPARQDVSAPLAPPQPAAKPKKQPFSLFKKR